MVWCVLRSCRFTVSTEWETVSCYRHRRRCESRAFAIRSSPAAAAAAAADDDILFQKSSLRPPPLSHPNNITLLLPH